MTTWHTNNNAHAHSRTCLGGVLEMRIWQSHRTGLGQGNGRVHNKTPSSPRRHHKHPPSRVPFRAVVFCVYLCACSYWNAGLGVTSAHIHTQHTCITYIHWIPDADPRTRCTSIHYSCWPPTTTTPPLMYNKGDTNSVWMWWWYTRHVLYMCDKCFAGFWATEECVSVRERSRVARGEIRRCASLMLNSGGEIARLVRCARIKMLFHEAATGAIKTHTSISSNFSLALDILNKYSCGTRERRTYASKKIH